MIWFREFRQNFELTDHFEELGGRYDIIHNTPSRRVIPGILPNPFIVTDTDQRGFCYRDVYAY